jgi:hypothetical protein
MRLPRPSWQLGWLLGAAALVGGALAIAVWVSSLAPRPGPDSAWPSQAALDQIRAMHDCRELANIRDNHSYEAMLAAGRDDHATANREGLLAAEADNRLAARRCNPDGTVKVPTGGAGASATSTTSVTVAR